MKNPQTTIAPTFLTHIISAIDGVLYLKKQRFGDTVWFPEGLENTPFKNKNKNGASHQTFDPSFFVWALTVLLPIPLNYLPYIEPEIVKSNIYTQSSWQ